VKAERAGRIMIKPDEIYVTLQGRRRGTLGRVWYISPSRCSSRTFSLWLPPLSRRNNLLTLALSLTQNWYH